MLHWALLSFINVISAAEPVGVYDQFPKLTVAETKGAVVQEEVSAASPRAWIVHNLLTPGQCAQIRAMTEGRLTAPSTVGEGPGQNVKKEIRRALTTPIGYDPFDKDNVTKHVHSYVSDTFGVDQSHVELLFVNKYGGGDFYKPHHDGRQRAHTILIYLNDLETGAGEHKRGLGGTGFPRALPMPLMVHPREGMALVWHNLHKNGSADIAAVHTGEPVPEGATKWVVNVWITSKPVYGWPAGWMHEVVALVTHHELTELEIIGGLFVLGLLMMQFWWWALSRVFGVGDSGGSYSDDSGSCDGGPPVVAKAGAGGKKPKPKPLFNKKKGAGRKQA
jgi:hypothetical protein